MTDSFSCNRGRIPNTFQLTLWMPLLLSAPRASPATCRIPVETVDAASPDVSMNDGVG